MVYPHPSVVEKMILLHPPIWIRAHAANMSVHNPDYLEAKITNKEDDLDTMRSHMNLTGGKCFDGCGGVGPDVHFHYKYQLILEGESAPWQRVPWMMLGGFVILRQESPQHQWFYSEMKPWVHYVPVAHDLSDLFETIDWLRANEDKAKEISDNAIAFAEYRFTLDRMLKFFKDMF